MKILFATDEKTMQSKIAKRFGHAEFYLIYDSDTKQFEVISNKEHDESHSNLPQLIANGVTNFIVGNIGPHAFEILTEGKAKIFLARLMTAEDALVKFQNNELEQLTQSSLPKSIHSHQKEKHSEGKHLHHHDNEVHEHGKHHNH